MVKRALSTPARALTALALLVGAAAVAAVLLVGGGTSVPATPAGLTHGPITVTAALQPAAAGVGDRIEARAVIALDRRSTHPGTLRYSLGVAPLTSLGPVHVFRVAHGDVELVTLLDPVACVTEACVSSKGPVTLRLAPVTATVTGTGGGVERVSARWPTLSVRGRVAGSLLTGQPKFEADATPPPVAYGVSPSLLVTLLSVVGVLAAVGAVGLAAWQAVLFARRRAAPGDADELQRAVRLTREAAKLPVPQRRRALELLARLVGRDELCSRASGLAWSRAEPAPDELEALADDAEAGR